MTRASPSGGALASNAPSGLEPVLASRLMDHWEQLVRGRLRLAGDDVQGGLEDLLGYGHVMRRLAFTGPACQPLWTSAKCITGARPFLLHRIGFRGSDRARRG